MQKFKITCKQLSFALPVNEPFFCTLAMHDVKNRKQASECFYFDLNSDELNAIWRGEVPDPAVTCRNCIISLPPIITADSLFLILRVYRLARGDLEKEAALFQKPKGV